MVVYKEELKICLEKVNDFVVHRKVCGNLNVLPD